MKLLNLVDLPKRTSLVRILSEAKEYLTLDDATLQKIHSPWDRKQILHWATGYVEDQAGYGDSWDINIEDEEDDFLFCLIGDGDSDKIVDHRGDYFNPEEGRIIYNISEATLTIVDSNDKEYLFDITQDLQDYVEGVIYY